MINTDSRIEQKQKLLDSIMELPKDGVVVPLLIGLFFWGHARRIAKLSNVVAELLEDGFFNDCDLEKYK